MDFAEALHARACPYSAPSWLCHQLPADGLDEDLGIVAARQINARV